MDTTKIVIPPIKCQGIKTKLVPLIKDKVHYADNGIWIEPFVGSGVVALNLAPRKAILSDKNQYIIAFYKGIQDGTITAQITREFLEYHGEKLKILGEIYYNEMRNEFNKNGNPLYFLFLNRADFNGMIRFNRQGKFNVPFCKKPDRFSKSYITKICNQVHSAATIIQSREWIFQCCTWQETFDRVTSKDYVYIDPPYIGRNTTYVGEWPEQEAVSLAACAHQVSANVCLSMWKENKYRKNIHLYDYWSDFTWYEQQHYYHLGAKESNRHPMIEVLAIKYP